MQTVTITLSNSTTNETITLKFKDEEWASIVDYAEEVKKLLATSFLRSASNFHLSLMFSSESKQAKVTTDTFNNEHWAAFLHFFRPMAGLNMDKELYGFLRIRKLMARQCRESAILSERLAHLLKQFKCLLLPFQTQFVIDGHSYDLEGLFTLWMNAREFHRDAAKADVLEKINHLMPDNGIRALIANLAIEKLRAMGGLQQLIVTLSGPPGSEMTLP